MRLLLIFLIISTAVSFANAQDKIIKKDKSTIECKIVEIGVEEIKFKLIDNDELVIAISVDEVMKVIFASGREMMFANPLEDPDLYEGDHKNALKMNFMSPVVGFLGFSYEKSLKPGKSIENEFGIIGIGFVDESAGGIYLASGLKFFKTPDFYSKRIKYSHVLKGTYIKPQLNLAIYGYENYYNYPTPGPVKENIIAGAILCHLGKQIVYNNSFVLDYSVGVGYGFVSQSETHTFYEATKLYHYGFLLTGSDVPVAFSAKLKIGFVF